MGTSSSKSAPQAASAESRLNHEQVAPPASSTSPANANTSALASDSVPLAPSKDRDPRYGKMPTPTELWDIGSQSLQTGAVTGGIGVLIGAGSGIFRQAPPTLFALVAGLQWFALGSSFMASRSILWHAYGGAENITPSERIKASGIAGGVSGMVGGMFRGPRNIIPGILVFGTLGAGSAYATPTSGRVESKPKTSWVDSKWSPLKRLSDKDYAMMVEEKLLRLDAEIAIINENIESLKASKEEVFASHAKSNEHETPNK
ncbi:hypothetical protein F5Y15DRAFT_40315 [Xylariaceae sp. FL0016]|nr:hypothetical protein F5Y15DRAFT_40315 [Xylariaceae sp. FL0016]